MAPPYALGEAALARGLDEATCGRSIRGCDMPISNLSEIMAINCAVSYIMTRSALNQSERLSTPS